MQQQKNKKVRFTGAEKRKLLPEQAYPPILLTRIRHGWTSPGAVDTSGRYMDFLVTANLIRKFSYLG